MEVISVSSTSFKKIISLSMTTLPRQGDMENNKTFFLTPMGVVSGRISTANDISGEAATSADISAKVTHQTLKQVPQIVEGLLR